MQSHETADNSAPAGTQPRTLTAAARRALEEAEQRRAAQTAVATKANDEINGRGGLEPVRYGDWEVKGIAYDF
ncbi:MAG: DUF1674 domain-containing protein [Hyphomicrobiales bacterium]|nr:DUF1674 domain-containing protein [Hyphomicrobiales bacterium]MDE2114102.1 DUF1674 domain-containing protein [Hyphomicrobiales bacterium]